MSDFTNALEAFHRALPPKLREKAIKAEADFAKAISDGDEGELQTALNERDAVLSHLTPAAKAALAQMNADGDGDGDADLGDGDSDGDADLGDGDGDGDGRLSEVA